MRCDWQMWLSVVDKEGIHICKKNATLSADKGKLRTDSPHHKNGKGRANKDMRKCLAFFHSERQPGVQGRVEGIGRGPGSESGFSPLLSVGHGLFTPACFAVIRAAKREPQHTHPRALHEQTAAYRDLHSTDLANVDFLLIHLFQTNLLKNTIREKRQQGTVMLL